MDNIKFKQHHVIPLQTRPYYLGLDIGTSSVGYAVTDPQYNLIRKSKKSLQGVHLFSEAKPKAERRIFRTARRRRKRQHLRIRLLQQFFAEAITQVDPGFFRRMKDSFFLPEDKREHQRNALFNDNDFNDKTYYDKYPTIYHLRKELCESVEPHDVRLVYLACHHILKNRGHFLSDQVSIGNDSKEQTLRDTFIEFVKLASPDEALPLWTEDQYTDVLKILCDKGTSRSDKNKSLQSLLSQKGTYEKEICKLISCCKVTMYNLFPSEEEEKKEILKKTELSLSDNYDEKTDLQQQLEDLLGENKDIIDLAYSLTQEILLHQLLQKNEKERYRLISEARIAVYEQHKNDLARLKAAFKGLKERFPEIEKNIQAQYDHLFNENKKKLNNKQLNNYVAYTGHTTNDCKVSPFVTCTQEEFLKEVKKVLEPYYDEIDDDLKRSIELNTFMPRIRSTANGVIPYQLHQYELSLILKNASKYLPFLTEEIQKKIIQIMSFRIPYYVGPFVPSFAKTDPSSEKFAWLKRKEGQEETSIRPWNLEEIVDLPETSERFIRAMTNKCTYLLSEDVLPKNSLLYEEYLARNAINNLRLNRQPLDKDTRELLYQDLFVQPIRSGRITKKQVLKRLQAYGAAQADSVLEGMDTDIPVKFQAHKDFRKYLDDEILTKNEVEEIISKLTVFPDSSKLIYSWLDERFTDRLSDEDKKKISNLRYKDWGRLSRKLLVGLKYTAPDQQRSTVLDLMREEGFNLMQVLFEKRYAFTERINEINKESVQDPLCITEDYLDSLRLSPPVHKALRRTLLLCKEVFSIMGGAPQKLFIEMPREKDTKKERTVTRKSKLAMLYRSVKKDCDLWNSLADIPEERFKSKALYLYALQQGRCMYTGEPIALEDLHNKQLYDIDHIYPRSLTKDDSFNNLVLVKQEANRAKKNKFPIDPDIQSLNKARWYALLKSGFMSEDKYFRLTRKEGLRPDELENFVNRQLVETRQSAKIISTVLSDILKETRVVFVKAGLVSDFRYRDGVNDKNKTQFYFPKVRDLNDYHHAKDAYLNIVVGNVYDTIFTEKFYLRLKNHETRYNLTNIFDRDVDGAWVAGPEGTILTVEKMMRRNDVLLSFETQRQRGGFFDQMIVKKGNGQQPIKSSSKALSDLSKYGGYNKVSASHFCIAKVRKKKKENFAIIPLPILLQKDDFSEKSICDYIATLGYDDFELLEREIKYGAIIEIDGLRYRLLAKTGKNLKCGLPIQAHYNDDLIVQIKDLERLLLKEDKGTVIDERMDTSSDIDLEHIYQILAKKLCSDPFIFYSSMRNQGDKLMQHVELYNGLSASRKIKIIFGILRLLSGNGNVVDLSDVYTLPGKSKTGEQSGMITITSNQKLDSIIKVIDVSITGFYEHVREIN